MNGNYRHANFAHADPHPGNYRFNTDGSVGFLDFGCVTIIPERQRRLWVMTLRALIEGRGHDCRTLMTQLGFLSAGSTLSTDDLLQWFSTTTYETIGPQPATYTPDSTSRTIRGFFDVRRGSPVTQVTLPPEHAFTSRISLAFASVAGGLHATLPIREIMDDLDGIVEPATELGKLHHAWVRERGLPSALDHHDHA